MKHNICVRVEEFFQPLSYSQRMEGPYDAKHGVSFATSEANNPIWTPMGIYYKRDS
jgi:hypothetical protein